MQNNMETQQHFGLLLTEEMVREWRKQEEQKTAI